MPDKINLKTKWQNNINDYAEIFAVFLSPY